jgi:hypothetical protein
MFPILKEAKDLGVFLGDWKVEGVMTFEGTPLKVAGRWKFDRAAAGWGLKATLKMEIEGMGLYEEDDLIGFDPSDGMVHLFTLTNTAAVHDHKGNWKNTRRLFLEYAGIQDGKTLTEEISVAFSGSEQFNIEEIDKLGGQVISTMDVTLKKT